MVGCVTSLVNAPDRRKAEGEATNPNCRDAIYRVSIPFFTSDGSKGINLYIVNADGTGLRQLTNNASTTATDSKPTWSPDGTKIAFVRYPTATGATAIPKIYVINVDGSGVRQLSDNDSNNYDVDPDWSVNFFVIPVYLKVRAIKSLLSFCLPTGI
jgi:dipeptidyl aminopeptidase/acylaminoacyl peptidase